METWVITCNPKYYDVVGAFNALDSIHWKQSVDIKVGDIVYIYVGKPLGTIKYETKAMGVNLLSPTIDDTEYVIDGSNYENYGRYMELKLVSKFEDYLLLYNLLKDNGLKSVQGPSRVSDQLEEFILNRTNPATIVELGELKKECDELEGITGLGADKEAVVKVRIGHGKFKKALLKRQDHCQVCGLDLEGLLIASHIKPWSKSDEYEKVDPDNGLLLCPNHDALFDKGLISFTDDGDLLLSFVVDPNAKGKLDLNNILKLSMSPKRKEYMAWHRENLFKSNNLVG